MNISQLPPNTSEEKVPRPLLTLAHRVVALGAAYRRIRFQSKETLLACIDSFIRERIEFADKVRTLSLARLAASLAQSARR